MSTATDDEATRKRIRLRELIGGNELVVMPGGFSPVYARLCEEAGFSCFFAAGSQMSGFLLGVPDTGILGLRDVVDHARHVAAQSGIPILLDADTGFGNATNVYFATQEIVRSGVAALQIEDQEAPKRSGTSAGRRCIPLDEAAGKVRAAVAARDELDPSFVICARVDSIGADGEDFAGTLARARAYAEAGADLVWLNAVERREQLREVCAATPRPVLCNWWSAVEPQPTLEEFAALGTRVALFPTIAASVGVQAAWHVLSDFHARGTPALADWAAQMKASPYGPADYRRFTGHQRVIDLDRQFLAPEARRAYSRRSYGGER